MYTELHARSAFSFLEGGSLPETLANTCADYGMAGMALLDRDGVYGAPRFHLATNKREIPAYVGAEVSSISGFRYPLLVRTRKGYQNLCRLITRMKLRAKKGEGAVSFEELADFAEGLICLTGGEEGPLAQQLAKVGVEGGQKCLEGLIRAFGRQNVYVELQRHFERKLETTRRLSWRGVSVYPCWLPTGSVMPLLKSGKSRTFSLVFVTIKRSRAPAGYFRAMRSGISSRPKLWLRSLLICHRLLLTRRN
jgi:error-prone DNA polymerase